jgi:hypothetical protein
MRYPLEGVNPALKRLVDAGKFDGRPTKNDRERVFSRIQMALDGAAQGTHRVTEHVISQDDISLGLVLDPVMTLLTNSRTSSDVNFAQCGLSKAQN